MSWTVLAQGNGIRYISGIVAKRAPADALHVVRHLGCGPTRERHEQDSPRISAIDDQMTDAVSGVLVFRKARRNAKME